MNTNYISLLLLLLLGLYSCSSDDDSGTMHGPEEEYSAGAADFSNYVSVGNSLTAGYTDGALFIAGQTNSLPNILATQFSLVGGGEFNQPLTNGNLGGLLLGGNPLPGFENRLYFNGSGPARLPGMPTTDISQILSGNYNNMGVPGALSYHLVIPGYGNIAGLQTGNANPYFVRFASSPSTSVIADAVAQNPTFFSLWIGNNDVLGYATGGGVGIDQTGNLDFATYATNDITDPDVFAQMYANIVSQLVQNDAKGIVANIPDITSIPYFTTVPYNAIPLDENTADAINGAYAAYNGGLVQAQGFGLITAEEVEKRTINFSAGQNAVVLIDEDLTDLTGVNPALINMRQATEEDLIPLPVSSVLGTLADPNNPQSVIGVGVPLDDGQVLIPSEQMHVKTATQAYNATIQAVAEQHGLALVDANAILTALSQEGGVPFDEFVLNDDLVFGGAFSLDGIHPTARGYAYLANKFLEAIEVEYEATLPRLKAADYNTLYPAQLP
ncbi:SGNH/GDSL hydrolase family protein [Galbibacter sp. PAP.153]|uniref:SGNH/GDSL hydrolase family protein n=1 Tax=Galbibacter sp. PAP.153 TaxID=3104623 RepID=UPI003008FBA2